MSDAPRLVFLLQRADHGVRKQLESVTRTSGVSAAAAGVLFTLRANPGALVGEVTAALGASPAGMSGLLARMEATGLVRKQVDPTDARGVRLWLTPPGEQAAAAASVTATELNEWLAHGFTDAELDVVRRWLERASSPDNS